MVNTVRKALEIVSTLSFEGPLGVSEISERLGYPKSSVHSIMETLSAYQFVERDQTSLRFHLGVRLIELGHRAHDALDIVKLATPILRHVNETLDETVHLTVLDNDEVLYLDCIESKKRLRTYSVVGIRAPLHCTSVGKAILAFQEPEEIERIIAERGLPGSTPNTITDREAMIDELGQTRKRGYALDNMEHEDHIRCVGAPVRNAQGTVFASISISAPVQRLPFDRVPEYADIVIAAAGDLSRRLGWQAPISAGSQRLTR